MREFLHLRLPVKIFIATVIAGGFFTIGYSLQHVNGHPVGGGWFVLALLTIITGSFTIRIPSLDAQLSVSETFVFSSVLLFGPEAGALTVLIECLVILFWMQPSARCPHRALFNLAAPAVAIWLSGHAFYLIAGTGPYSIQTGPLPQLSELFLPLSTFTVLYFLLNSWLVAVAVGMENGRSPIEIWKDNFIWLSVNYFSGASVAALIIAYTRDLSLSIFAIILPLLIVSYLTFRTAMGRLEDSNRHLSQLTKLHLATVETLALAIDAKDQVTHGHIRRVQTYALELAQRLGVGDIQLIKAIEAAALLHDMGKLAVPEHILNKPGKLTDAEFDKMKLHASVGADILSSIEFPYPVVPIVRHHHENWDGTGYPAGLKGTDIPLGARILSVVDCFDALTSDRPYRPKLSEADALHILKDRRGSMYDPLIVDTFVKVFRDIALATTSADVPKRILDTITNSSQAVMLRDDTSQRSVKRMEEVQPLTDSLNDVGIYLARLLRARIRFAYSVFYQYDVRSDCLAARLISGPSTYRLLRHRIQLGEGVSGWVAAQRRTIINADPTLELGGGPLRSCLSTPVLTDNELIGVLTLYAADKDAFTEENGSALELVADRVAPTLANLGAVLPAKISRN